MSAKKWMVVSITLSAAAAIAAYAFTNPVQVFRTYAGLLGVSQGHNLDSQPQYEYTVFAGSNLVALALGTTPTSNQVFAMTVDCGSSQAALVVFDKSNSNITTIATSTGISTVVNQGLKSSFVNSERFVAEFNVESIGDLLGGTLMVSGRLHLGTNGCPVTVPINLDRDPEDAAAGDVNLTDKNDKVKIIVRAGQANLIGVLSILANGTTNTVLVPAGHLTFAEKLNQFDVVP